MIFLENSSFAVSTCIFILLSILPVDRPPSVCDQVTNPSVNCIKGEDGKVHCTPEASVIRATIS